MRKTSIPPMSHSTAPWGSRARRERRRLRHRAAPAVQPLEQRTFLSADLTVTDVNAPSSGSVGGSILVGWTVTNAAPPDPANAATARWSDGVYLSTDSVLDGDDTRIQLVSARSRSPLAAGASYSVTSNVIIPGDTPVGTYHVIVQTDDLVDQQPESDESNNWMAAPGTLTLGAPDLAITSVTYPATAIPGTSLSFSFTVTNNSPTYDADGFWTDGAVLSGDDVYGNGDDIFLGEWANPSALAPGASYVSSQTVTVPDGAGSANFLLIKTDNHLAQGESDETNNVSASPIQTRPLISVGDVTLAEGQSGTTSATFAVTLDVASTQTVSVNWATADGTANAGTDYVASGGTLTFNPGQTSRTISVLVNGDKLRENNETFSVNLSGAVNAGIADSQGIATITNDDATPVAQPDAYAVDSGSVLNVAAPGVVGNDTDANGDTLGAVLNAGPSHGSLSLNADGSFAYTPANGYVGNDSFSGIL